MAVSATIINEDKLGIKFPLELRDIPVSFQSTFNNYWEPIIKKLELPTLRWIGVLDVDYTLWPKFKHEMLTIRNFLQESPNIAVSICTEPAGGDIGVINEYIIPRIDELLRRMQKAYDLSDKVIFNL